MMNDNSYLLNIDTIPLNIAIYEYDYKKDDFKFIDFNISAEYTEKITKDELIGKYLTKIFPSVKEFGIFDIFKQVLKTGKYQIHKTEFYKDNRISGWRENEIYRINNNYIMAIYKDLSADKSLENKLKMLGGVVDNSFNEVFIFNTDDFKFTYVNEQAKKNLGYSDEELFDLYPWDIKLTYNEKSFKDYLKDSEFKILETSHIRKDGTSYFVEAKVQKMILENEEKYVAIVSDVTQKKYYEDKLMLSKEVISSISEAVIITDLNSTIIDINPAYERLSGFKREDVIGKSPKIFKSGRHKKSFYKQMWSELLENGFYRGEIWDRKASGELFLKDLRISVLRDENGNAKNYVGVFTDITEAKDYEKELYELAFTDALTGLTNRAQFKNILKHELDVTYRNKNKGALLLIDLDMFKKVNDTLGHLIGDELLIDVSNRLKSIVRKSDTVSRIGGDEFTIILASPIKEQKVQFIAQEVIDQLCKPYNIDNHEIFINSSIGIAFYPDDGKDVNTLIKSADLAMYKAKDSGRGHYQFFQAKMHDESIKNRTIETELREALSSGKIVPYYQPKVNPENGRVIGVEALARWEHKEQGVLSPIYFLDVAEDSGLIHKLGEEILLQSLKDIKVLNEMGYPELSVAVNLSPKQFEDDKLIKKILKKIKNEKVDVNNLELEITESLIMEDIERAVKMMNVLTEHNIKISIDDFGTGYSSLNSLKKFPISYLKIDKSFVDGIVDFKDDKAIVQTIIAMAQSLNIGVIAEGVETIEQEKHLLEMSCHLCQGYLYSKALSFEDLKKFLDK